MSCLKYYEDTQIKIIHLEGFEHNWDLIPYLNNRIYTFITWPCYFHKWLYELSVNSLYTQNSTYDKHNIIWLSPDLDGILWAFEYGFKAILCNHNCLLDYTRFTIIPEKDIIYDLVMNCRPEKWKRPDLAENVENLAYIKGIAYGQKEVYDYTKLNCKYMNINRIPLLEVMKIYNQSYCGGIFSESEGACYSSSEYLLCGLPVISTVSRGGRDTWYNKKNSLIIDPTREAVTTAIELCKYNITHNIFDREEIRKTHIELSNKMRMNFIKHTQMIFDCHNIHADASAYWDSVYFNKMKDSFEVDKCAEKLSF